MTYEDNSPVVGLIENTPSGLLTLLSEECFFPNGSDKGWLGKIKEAYDADPELPNLLLAPYFVETIKKCESAWRQVVSQGALLGVPTPAFSTALSFFDGYRCARLPANLLQAQRDYFGAHTFERLEHTGPADDAASLPERPYEIERLDSISRRV